VEQARLQRQSDCSLPAEAENLAAFVQVRVNKWLKDLERMFYGSCESYEKVSSTCTAEYPKGVLHALCIYAPAVSVATTPKLVKLQALKGQEDMTDVLLRNVYGDDTSKRHNAATLAQYVRRCAEKAGVSMLQSAKLR
jgi:hypothetical protein